MTLDDIVVNEMKYIITSAQKDAVPNIEFIDSLKQYADYNEVDKIYILPIAGKSVADEDLNNIFYNDDRFEIISKDKNLNSHIKISNYEIKPQQMIPTTGLARFAKADISTIFGSPKQSFLPVPNSNRKLPKVLLTTGAITHPRYNLNVRTGRIAQKDHQYGAIFVETNGNKEYHFRHINALKNGKFQDFDSIYTSSKIITGVRPEAMILADWHTGATDSNVRKTTFEMIQKYNPKRVIFHDIFDANSISHHDMNKIVTLSKKSSNLSLEKEIKELYKELRTISEEASDSEIYIVKSNHDEHLNRYIEEGRFIDEPQNALIGSKILTGMIEGSDPLVYALELYGEIPENIKFLTREDDLMVRGYQLGSHGDQGANGARGSPRTMESAFGKAVTGHRHSPFMLRNTLGVGTSTGRLPYQTGLDSNMNTHAFIYETGKGQLVNIINKKYKI